MATPIKRIPKEKVAILHTCSEEDRIRKIELILVGNGNPEEGYIYKVVEMGKEVKDINQKLTGISGIVKELHEKSIGENAIIKTEKEKRAERRLEWAKWIQTGMFILGAIALLYTAYNTHRNSKVNEKIDNKVENLGVPVITRNGKILAVPDSTQIQFFPHDSIKYTIKRD